MIKQDVVRVQQALESQLATSPVLKSSSKTAEALADLAFTELLARSDETKGKRDQLVRVTNHEELDRRFRALMIGDMDEGAAQVVIGDLIEVSFWLLGVRPPARPWRRRTGIGSWQERPRRGRSRCFLGILWGNAGSACGRACGSVSRSKTASSSAAIL